MKPKFQLFIEHAFLSFLTCVKIILLSKWIKKPKITGIKKSLVILGNSPNLNTTLSQHSQFLTDKDSLCVNFFWKSEFFQIVKPRIYVISSLSYWAKDKIDLNDQGRKLTFITLAEKVSWNMILYVPIQAKSHKEWKQIIAQNSNIQIIYYNLTPIEGLPILNHMFLNLNLGTPRPHNVLIPSITLGLNVGYKSIYLLGAEHSWLQDIHVAHDNKVYVTQRHFYNATDAKPEVMYKGIKNEERTLGQVLLKFMYTFNSYFDLKEYAQSKNAVIYNATKDSYIDAFERISLE